MKTLDEVIAELEDEGLFADALYHLNKYRMTLDDIVAKRKTLEAEIDRYQEAVKNCEEAENKYRKAEQDALKALDDWASRPVEDNKNLVLTVANPPLTWDELKTMEGKPVWVEADDGKYKGWVIVGKFYSLLEEEELDAHVDLYYFGRSMEYSKEMYGYYWQAYRKERNR